MNDTVIESVKLFATLHNTSVSKLAERYFENLTRDIRYDKKTITGVVRELAGVFKDKNIDTSKTESINYLEEKYM